MAKNSGITKGKSHKEGGIPMTVKSTGQKIEVEGGEGIVNKYAMSNTDTFHFEGKEKTSCEIISDLNQKKGDGVSFECDTVENKKYKFKKGGKLNFTTSEDFYSRMEKTIKEAYEFLNQYEYKRSRYDSPKLAVNVKLYNVNYDIDEALETYQNRKGNFDMDKMRYVKKDLYLDEQWVYEQYNRFLDDTLYFFKEELLEDFGDVLKDKQIYQEGRSGGWLVFNDDGELSEMVDELESILNNNFAEDGELVGNDRWGYDMEPVTFKEFKEEGEYDDAIYYAERIKYLLTDYEDIVENIKKTHKDVPANWKAFLDEKVDEHISEDKKRYKIFTEDDPDFAKGGKITGVGKSGLDKIKKTSKDNPSQMYKVTDDNYSNIGNFYLKNGKFAKMTVSNADYDFAYNKVSLRPKRDVIYKATEIEGKGGYFAKGGEIKNEGYFVAIDRGGNALTLFQSDSGKWDEVTKSKEDVKKLDVEEFADESQSVEAIPVKKITKVNPNNLSKGFNSIPKGGFVVLLVAEPSKENPIGIQHWVTMDMEGDTNWGKEATEEQLEDFAEDGLTPTIYVLSLDDTEIMTLQEGEEESWEDYEDYAKGGLTVSDAQDKIKDTATPIIFGVNDEKRLTFFTAIRDTEDEGKRVFYISNGGYDEPQDGVMYLDDFFDNDSLQTKEIMAVYTDGFDIVPVTAIKKTTKDMRLSEMVDGDYEMEIKGTEYDSLIPKGTNYLFVDYDEHFGSMAKGGKLSKQVVPLIEMFRERAELIREGKDDEADKIKWDIEIAYHKLRHDKQREFRKEVREEMKKDNYAKGGETTSWGGVRGRLNIPQLSFSKVDYDVNVNPKNLEVDVNIKASDSVNHYDLNDTDANWEQHTWGYMVYPKSEKQLYDVLKALRVSVSKKRLADFVKDGNYAKGGKTKSEMDVFVQLQEENKKEIRYLMIGKQGKKGFSGLIIDYVGGGQFQEFYFADGIDIESELYDQTDGDYDNDEVTDAFIDKKGMDFYNLIHETMDDGVDFGDDYQPILQKNPPKNKLAYYTGDITPITVGMTIFEDESKGKYAKGGKTDKKVYVLKKVVWKAREEDGWRKPALDEWEESVNKEFTNPDELHKAMWKFVEKALVFEGRLYYSFDDRGEELPNLMDMLNDKLKSTKHQIVQRTYPYVGNHGLFIKGPDGKYLSGKDKVPKKVQNIVDNWWNAISEMKDKDEFVNEYAIGFEYENPAYLGDVYVEEIDKEYKEGDYYKDFDDIWPIDDSPYAKSPAATIGSSFMLVEVNPRQYRPSMDEEEWDSDLERAIDLEVRFDIEVYEIKDGKKIAILPGDEDDYNEEFYGDITSYAKGGMTKNERVEKGFPKNPENITKDELHEHFDLNNDGKVTLEEYAEHIDYHCENPEVLDGELEEAYYQRMFMYAKGGFLSRLFGGKPKKSETSKKLRRYNHTYIISDKKGNPIIKGDASNPATSRKEAHDKLKKSLQENIDSGYYEDGDKIEIFTPKQYKESKYFKKGYAKGGVTTRLNNIEDQLEDNAYEIRRNQREIYNLEQKFTPRIGGYAKGGRIKYLSDYINDKNSKLFKETGTFFAFSSEQFKEQMKEGKKYVDMGGGMITEKGNEEKLVKGLNKNYKEGVKQDLKENGKEKVILRELQNHEAFYTGDIENTVETLKDYPGIKAEDIMKSYRKNYSKYSDFAKGGSVKEYYVSFDVGSEDWGTNIEAENKSEAEKKAIELFREQNPNSSSYDVENIKVENFAKGGRVMSLERLAQKLERAYPNIRMTENEDSISVFEDFPTDRRGDSIADYYSESQDRVFGMANHFDNFLKRNGYWAEWVNPEHFKIYKLDGYAKGGSVKLGKDGDIGITEEQYKEYEEMVNNPRGMSHNARKTNPLYLESGSGYPLSEYYSDKPLTEAQKFNLMQRLESDGTEIISDWEAQRLENLEMGEGDENGITEDMKGLSKSTNMYKMSYVKPKFKTILAQPRGGSIRFMAKGGATESCSKCGGEGEIEIKNNFDDGRGDYVWEDCDECDNSKGGEVYRVSGYWKDDGSEFNDYLISEYDDVPKGYDDDDIFYYGLSEDDLKNSSKDDILEFVITDYEPVSKNYSKGGILGKKSIDNLTKEEWVKYVKEAIKKYKLKDEIKHYDYVVDYYKKGKDEEGNDWSFHYGDESGEDGLWDASNRVIREQDKEYEDWPGESPDQGLVYYGLKELTWQQMTEKERERADKEGKDDYAKGGYTANVEEASWKIERWLMIDERDDETWDIWFDAIDKRDHEQIKSMIEDFADDDSLAFYGIKSDKDVEELAKYFTRERKMAKGGKPSGYLFGRGNKHKYASNEQLVERIENLRVKKRLDPDINIDNEMSELLSRQEAQGFKVEDDNYGLRIHYNSNEARKKSQNLYYAKGGKIEVGDVVRATKDNFPHSISGMGKGERGKVEEIIKLRADGDDGGVAIVEATNGRRVEAMIKNLETFAKGGVTEAKKYFIDFGYIDDLRSDERYFVDILLKDNVSKKEVAEAKNYFYQTDNLYGDKKHYVDNLIKFREREMYTFAKGGKIIENKGPVKKDETDVDVAYSVKIWGDPSKDPTEPPYENPDDRWVGREETYSDAMKLLNENHKELKEGESITIYAESKYAGEDEDKFYDEIRDEVRYVKVGPSGGELDEYYSKVVDKLGKDGAFIRVLKDSQFSRNTNMGENEYIYFRNGKDIRATVSNETVNLYGMVSETFTSPKELAEYLDENEIFAKGGTAKKTDVIRKQLTTDNVYELRDLAFRFEDYDTFKEYDLNTHGYNSVRGGSYENNIGYGEADHFGEGDDGWYDEELDAYISNDQKVALMYTNIDSDGYDVAVIEYLEPLKEIKIKNK